MGLPVALQTGAVVALAIVTLASLVLLVIVARERWLAVRFRRRHAE